MFLQVSVTSGILGFFSYIFLLLTFLSKLYKISKSEENWIPPALFSSLIAYIIQSIFNPIVPDIKLLFFGILGFTGAYCKRSDLIIIKNLKFFWKIFLYILISLFLMYLVLPSISNNFAGDYNFRKGKYYEMKGKLDKAVEYLILAVENNPKNPSYHRELGFVYREIAKFKNLPRDKKKYFLEESIKKYQDAIKLNPYDASLYSDLAKVYSIYAVELEKKFSQKAIKCYEIAIKKDPNYSIFHNYLGVLYLNLGKYKNAEKEFEITKKLTPNFIEPYINLGVLYYKNKNYQKAIEISIQAIKNNLESVELYANLGIFYKEIKEYKKAKKMIERAIKLNPDNPSLEKLLGEIEEEWKKNSKKY
jgi:tetratricopeptide (TPR) repeat protein